mgnify:CR=1 FL=1
MVRRAPRASSLRVTDWRVFYYTIGCAPPSLVYFFLHLPISSFVSLSSILIRLSSDRALAGKLFIFVPREFFHKSRAESYQITLLSLFRDYVDSRSFKIVFVVKEVILQSTAYLRLAKFTVESFHYK